MLTSAPFFFREPSACSREEEREGGRGVGVERNVEKGMEKGGREGGRLETYLLS